jgi:ribonuclease HI
MAANGPPRFVAFTDGSSLVNPGGPGGTGFVVLDRARLAVRFGGTRWVEDGPSGVTNNRMELRAMLDAFHGLPDGETVEARSDSRYVIDSLSRWIHGWRRKGWRTASGGPVLNRDIIEELSAREASLRVRYTWVRGHVGHPVNEICDELASAAARGQPGPGQEAVFAALRAENLLAAADLPRVVASIGASIGEAQPGAARPESGQLTMRL